MGICYIVTPHLLYFFCSNFIIVVFIVIFLFVFVVIVAVFTSEASLVCFIFQALTYESY